jgi:zinc transport system substrate-binding protein
LLALLALLCLGGAAGAANPETGEREVLSVFVSIPPQSHFVDQIAGNAAAVHVLVGPGRSPATYEPTPRQMALLAEADILFTVGVPFEAAWVERIRALNPELRIVETWPRAAPEARDVDAHASAGHAHGAGGDPHAWTDPQQVEAMCAAMRDALCASRPARCEEFTENLRRFAAALDSLDLEIRALLAEGTGRRFMVYHPAWGDFAAAYDLEQLAIEREGKEPGARGLSRCIDEARAAGVRVIYVQPQFTADAAATVAEAIGARLESLDPLAEDYCANLRAVATAIAAGLY